MIMQFLRRLFWMSKVALLFAVVVWCSITLVTSLWKLGQISMLCLTLVSLSSTFGAQSRTGVSVLNRSEGRQILLRFTDCLISISHVWNHLHLFPFFLKRKSLSHKDSSGAWSKHHFLCVYLGWITCLIPLESIWQAFLTKSELYL